MIWGCISELPSKDLISAPNFSDTSGSDDRTGLYREEVIPEKQFYNIIRKVITLQNWAKKAALSISINILHAQLHIFIYE